MPKLPAFDPSVIDSAPVEPEPGSVPAGEKTLIDQLIVVSEALAEKQAEADRLKGERSAEQVAAGLMEPAANKVFTFVVWYCLAVAGFLLLSGFAVRGFHLSDTILSIIAGSTAVSVIGLMGMVVTGIFGKALPKRTGKSGAKKLAGTKA